MRRLALFAGVVVVGAGLAACGGSSSDGEATATPADLPLATTTAAPTRAGGGATPISVEVTPSATPTAPATAETPSPTPTAAVTNPPATNPPATNPPPTQLPPTPTPPPASSNPLSATIGASGGGARFFWVPANVTIAPGGTVTWTWSEPVQPHNVSGGNFALSTDPKKADTVSFTFAAAGVYTFVCDIHPDTMRGTVTVQ